MSVSGGALVGIEKSDGGGGGDVGGFGWCSLVGAISRCQLGIYCLETGEQWAL